MYPTNPWREISQEGICQEHCELPANVCGGLLPLIEDRLASPVTVKYVGCSVCKVPV